MQSVVLIHGALASGADMELALGSALRQYDVTAVDRPGRGSKIAMQHTGSLQRQAALLHDEMRVTGAKRPILVGHSFGAAVALSWALKFPADVRGVVAIAPIAFPELRLEHLIFGPRGIPVFGRGWNAAARIMVDPLMIPDIRRRMFKPQGIPAGYDEKVPLEIRDGNDPLIAEGEDALHMVRGLAENAGSYRHCTVPVRVLLGDADTVVNKELHGKPLCAALPDATCQELPGLGHMLHHFAQSEVTALVDDLAG
jgi:pimeloyl-ACP methyl ester carboxylesterase